MENKNYESFKNKKEYNRIFTFIRPNNCSNGFASCSLTIILFQKGLSLAQIMMVQTAYSIAVFIFEYPSGLWADLYSKKFLFVLSRILLIIMMVIVLLMRNTIWMEIAWFIYGISSALDSGTLDADIINSLKKIIKNQN